MRFVSVDRSGEWAVLSFRIALAFFFDTMSFRNVGSRPFSDLKLALALTSFTLFPEKTAKAGLVSRLRLSKFLLRVRFSCARPGYRVLSNLESSFAVPYFL